MKRSECAVRKLEDKDIRGANTKLILDGIDDDGIRHCVLPTSQTGEWRGMRCVEKRQETMLVKVKEQNMQMSYLLMHKAWELL